MANDLTILLFFLAVDMQLASGHIKELLSISQPEKIPFSDCNIAAIQAKFQKIDEFCITNVEGIQKVLRLQSLETICSIPEECREIMHGTLKTLHEQGHWKQWHQPTFAEYIAQLVQAGVVIPEFPNNKIIYNKEHTTMALRALLAVYLKVPGLEGVLANLDHLPRAE